jgi:O-antigen ligase
MQTIRYRVYPLPLGEKFIDILILGIILGMVLHGKGSIITKTPMNRLLVIWGLFLYASLWMGAHWLGADAPISLHDPRFSFWKNYVEMPLLFALAVGAIQEVRHIKILLLVMAISVLLIHLSFYRTMGDHDLSSYSDALREAGVLGYAGENGLGAFEAQLSLFLLGFYACEKKRWIRLGILLLLFTALYGLLFSFSRGGYLAFLAGTTFLGVIKKRKLLLIVATLVIGWQLFLPTAVKERIAMTENSQGQLDNSAQIRVKLWKDAVQLVESNPWLGTGFFTYAYMGRLEGLRRDTHNYYLKMLVETGFVGLLLFLWILAKLFRSGFTLYLTTQDDFLRSLGLGFATLMVGAVVVNVFGDRWAYIEVNGFLWVLLGLVMRGLHIVRQSQKEAEPMVAPLPLVAQPTRQISPA